MRGVVIPAAPDRAIRPLVTQHDELAAVQAAVSGWIEIVSCDCRLPDFDPWPLTVIVDEEGLLKHRQPNQRASVIANQTLVGDVVVLGPLEPSDDGLVWTDLTDTQMARFLGCEVSELPIGVW